MTATLGIQYANAPRFALPIPLEDSHALGSFGPAPPQPDRPIGLFVFGPVGATDEECLYLNGWTPDSGGGRRSR